MYYCPAGTSDRQVVDDNYYTIPASADHITTRYGQEPCPADKVCVGGEMLAAASFTQTTCPAGFTTRAIEEGATGNVGDKVEATKAPGYSGTLAHSIVSGSVSSNSGCNVNNPFSITATNGQLALGTALDREYCSQFNVTVRATVGSDYSDCVVTVNVLDVNEAPSVTDCGSGSISLTVEERSPVNTQVGSPIAATDPDAGQVLLFTVPNNLSPFTIGACDGQIKVRRDELDFAKTDSYSFDVVVQDDGIPQQQATCTINIAVQNKDDPPSLTGKTVSASESAAAGSELLTATATDADGTSGLKYSIYRQDEPKLFVIGESSGVVSLAANAQLDYETKASHSIGLAVTDGTSEAKADFTITVVDANDAPTISGPSTLSIPENAVAGTTVGSAFVAGDQDAGHKASLNWAVSTNDFFTITNAGQVQLKAAAPSYEGTSQSTALSISVTDPGGLKAFKSVTVKTSDVNEAPEKPTGLSLPFTVREDASVGTSVGNKVAFTDPDASQTLSYSILSGGDGAFAIDAGSGQLRVASKLDFETKPTYTITVQACDSGSPKLCSTDSISVSLEDTTEAPVFASGQSRSIQENSAAGTVVGSAFSVSDQDAGDSISCSIVSGNIADAFEFVPSSCQLRVKSKSALDAEKRPVFVLDVRATDDSADARSTDATVTVTLVDVNEMPLITDSEDQRAVPELASAGLLVGPPVTGFDPDEDDQITWTIDTATTPSAMAALFAINPTTGQITTKTSVPSNMESTSFVDVRATDKQGLSSKVSLVIQFSDSNAAPTLPAGSITVSESAAVGTLLTPIVQGSDSDGHDLRYAITAGNQGNAFAIDSTTGQIRVLSALDHETTRSYSLTITATDIPGVMNGVTQPPLTAFATWTVSVTDAPEPPNVPSATRSIAENTASGTAVGDPIAATDEDDGDTLSFAIVAGNAGGAFSIDSTTGQLRVAKTSALNYETSSEFALDVTVTDSHGKATTARVTVSVGDVNDAPALASPAAASIPENSPIGSVIGSPLVATDEDGDAVSLSITSGNDKGVFSLSQSGVLSLAKSPSYEAGSSYSLLITATDARGMTDSATWAITIADIPENPTYVSPVAAAVSESASVGSLVATAMATDEDTGDTLRFSIDGGSDLFAISPTSGAITVKSALNHEESSSHTLRVIVTDRKGLTDSQEVVISVTDVNEAPVIATSTLSIDETATAGANVGTVKVSDEDEGQTVSLAITGGAGPSSSPYFTIDRSTGVVSLGTGASLDYEEERGVKRFTLTVTATDSASSPLTTTKTVVVDVKDKNERPVFADSVRDIAENSPVNTPVGAPLVATDEDLDQTLSFKILSGNDDAHLKIDSCSGQIKVAKDDIDFEVKSTYNLQVQVTDDGAAVPGPARLSTVALVTVRVQDVNERPRVPDVSRSIPENSATGTNVGQAVAVFDEDVADTHTFAIAGGNSNGAFSIGANSGVITVQTPSALNYEVTPTVVLNVSATDDGDDPASLTGWGLVTISVTDINEPPKFNQSAPAAKPSLAENSPAGTAVGSPLPGYEEDKGQSITFTLENEDDSDLFTITENGQLRVAEGASIDYESRATRSIVVRMTDDSPDTPLSSVVPVTITVENVNEAPTLPATATVNVDEDVPAATPVGGTASRGRDVDAGDVLSYTLVSQSVEGAFRVLPNSGAVEVFTASLVDFESAPSHTLKVRVKDNGGLTADGVISVSVNDKNEPPTMPQGQRRAVDENALGTSTGEPIVANDVDAADPVYSTVGGLRFAIVPGMGAANQFRINATSGVLRTADDATLNHEVDDQVFVEVRVTDHGGLTVSQNVTIDIKDVNERPTIGESFYPFTVQENAKQGQEVGRITASDVDEGDTLTFSLNVTNPGASGLASHFSIDPSSGRILVAKASPSGVSEYLPKGNEYDMIVTVTDAGGLTHTTRVTVDVAPVNDPPVLADPAGVVLQVNENALGTTVVGQVTATDPDGDAVSYRLLNRVGILQIESQTGRITVAEGAELDYEKLPRFSVTVAASDSQLEVTKDYEVVLLDVGEHPQFVASSLVMRTPENPTTMGAVVGQLRATDVDSQDTSLVYTMESSGHQSHFTIDSDTGTIRVASAEINRELTSSYTIEVRVTDSYGLSDSGQLSIFVEDLNDAPLLSDAAAEVQENAAAAKLVLPSLQSSDEDSDQLVSFRAGRSPCWSHTPAKAGLAAWAPIAADGPMRASFVVVGKKELVRTRTGAARLLVGAATESENYKTPTGSRYEVVIGTQSNGNTVQLLRCDGAAPCSDTEDILATASANETYVQYFLSIDEDVDLVTVSGANSSSATAVDATVVLKHTDSAGVVRARRVGFSAASLAGSPRATRVCFNNAKASAAERFQVSESTGAVTVAQGAELDFESQRWFGLEVVASDNGEPALSSAGGVVQIAVTDQNEVLTWSTSACAASSADDAQYSACFSVPENTLPGSVAAGLGSLAGLAVDPDTLAAQTLSYTMSADGNTDSAGRRVFAVEASSAKISLQRNSLDFETADRWVLDVTATDDGTPPLSADTRVLVQVQDVNERPELGGGSRSVPENSIPGSTLIGGPVLATDVDAGDWGTLSYAIIGGTGAALFSVDAESGVLSVNDTQQIRAGGVNSEVHPLNFERLDRASYSLELEVTDGGGLTDSATFAVTITNVNERPSINDTVRRISEAAEALTRAGDPVPSDDPDNHHPVLGLVQQLQYVVMGGDGDSVFKMDSCSGQIELRPGQSLDFEDKSTYTLLVKLQDDGEPQLADTATITVEIEDANDAPVIIQPKHGYVLFVEELTDVGTQLTNEDVGYDRISASDEDEHSTRASTWANQTWTIAAGNQLGIFSIEAGSGVLRVAKGGRLDFEDPNVNQFSLTVRVCDSGEPALCDETPVSVVVTDRNEPPSLDSVVRSVPETTDLAEQLQVGQAVGRPFRASDPDGSDAEAQLAFTIIAGNDDGFFELDSRSPSVTVRVTDAGAVGLDHETRNEYTLVLRVTDEGGLSDHANITVAVEDVNEFPFISDAEFAIAENSAILSEVAGTANQVVDEDQGDTHTYRIESQSPPGVFKMLSSDGQLEVLSSAGLDYETNAVHTLQVRVTDRGGLSDTAIWTVQVVDEQEPPTIDDFSFAGLLENSVEGTVVGAISGSDPDAADKGELRYEIVRQPMSGQGDPVFAVDAVTGLLTVLAPSDAALAQLNPWDANSTVNYEFLAEHVLDVRIKDSVGNTDDARVTIGIENVNEPPRMEDGTFITPASRDAEIGYFTVYTQDYDKDDAHTYRIVSGNTDETFAVDASSGLLYVKDNATAAFRFDDSLPEGEPSFTLRVEVEDQGGLTGQTNFQVVLVNSNERPEIRTRTSTPFTVPENSIDGTVVATIIATDHNADQKLTYFIEPRGKNVNRPFPFMMRTVPSTSAENGAQNKGEIVVIREDPETGEPLDVDFEGLFSTYDVVVVAADDHSTLTLAATKQATIRLLDISEAPTLQLPAGIAAGSGEPLTMTLPELATSGTLLRNHAPLAAQDVDASSDGELRFSIVDGSFEPQAAADLFAVDPTTGNVEFRGTQANLNFEDDALNSFLFTARVEDEAGLVDEHEVVIQVTDENEPPALSKATYTMQVRENAAAGTVLGQVVASDPDTAGTERASLSLELSDPSGDQLHLAFVVDPDGFVSVAAGANLDWEDRDEYNLVVTVSDADPINPLSASASLRILVRDENDVVVVGFQVTETVVESGQAWNVIPLAGSNVTQMFGGSVVDWEASHGSMDAIFASAGGAEVLIFGSNLGLSASRLAREGFTSAADTVIVSASYGPTFGTKYEARDCRVVVPGTTVACKLAPGVGRDHFWTLTVEYTASTQKAGAPAPETGKAVSAAMTGYAPPILARVEVVDGATTIGTAGQELVRLVGENFGPSGYTDRLGEFTPTGVFVRYGPSNGALSRKYTGAGCMVEVEHVSVLCNTSEGIGAELAFDVQIGGQASQPLTTGLSYTPPSVASAPQFALATEGQEEIILRGANFGPAGTVSPDVTAQYHWSLLSTVQGTLAGASAPKPYDALRCRVPEERPHEELRCVSVPGVGLNHAWVVTVGGQASVPSDAAGEMGLTRYRAPTIRKISGQGADMADTSGGQQVIIDGENFGPATLVDADGNIISDDIPIAEYGKPNEMWPSFMAVDCRVTVAFRQVVCQTTEGTGRGLVWELEIGGQRSGIFANRTTSYHPPVVAYYSGEGARDADTRGEEHVVIEGRNFGPIGTPVENVTYGPAGSVSEFVASDCRVLESHTKVLCLTAVGAGRDLAWSVRIDGQDSVSPTTDYHIPIVAGFSGVGAEDASTDGGDRVRVFGDFLSVNRHLGEVTYGPTGSEFEAVDCQVVEDHSAIDCMTVPGTGRVLRWLVTVGDQQSQLSSDFTSYAPPRILTVEPNAGPTSGALPESGSPVMVRVTGSDFGLAYPLSRLSIRMNAVGRESPSPAAIATYMDAIYRGLSSEIADPAVHSWLHSLETPRVEATGVTPSGDHFVDFLLPEGFGVDRELFVEVDGIPSFPALFTYEAPEIRNVAPDRQGVELGLLNVFIDGVNFCSGQGSCGVVKVDGQVVDPQSHTHSQVHIVIPDPATTTTDLVVIVSVDGVDSNAVSFRKPVPAFSAANQGKDWVAMSGEGGEELELNHISDIGTVPATEIKVWIGPYLAGPVTKFKFGTDEEDNTDSIRFASPAGVGVDHDVVIEVPPAARSRANAFKFSFAAPAIASVEGIRGEPVMDEEATTRANGARVLASLGAGVFGLDTPGDQLVIHGSGFGTPDLGGSPVAVMDESTPLQIVSQDHRRLVLQIPAGDGSGHSVSYVVGGQSSHAAGEVAVRYAPPNVTSVAPCVAADRSPTAGGVDVCIRGHNFGVSRPRITIGGKLCVSPSAADGASYPLEPVSHSLIRCSSPAGEGADLPVLVTVNAQVSAEAPAATYSYNTPVVTGITPANGPTSGRGMPEVDPETGEVVADGERIVMTLFGEDLGAQAPTILFRPGPLMLGTSSALMVPPEDVIFHNHTHVTFYMPEGFGVDRQVHVVAGGQESTSFARFEYDPPSVEEIGRADLPPGACFERIQCFIDPAVAAFNATCRENPAVCEECRAKSAECWDTRGQYPLRVRGASFGRAGEAEVRIGEWLCQQTASQSTRQTHNEVVCTVPRGIGENLPVVVTVGTRSSVVTQSARFSYDPPIVSQAVPNRPDASGERIQFQGKNFGWEKRPVEVFIGGVACQNAEWLNDATVECDAPSAPAGLKNITVLAANRSEPVFIASYESVLSYECKFGSYGIFGEECLSCEEHARGAVCEGGEDFFDLIRADEGWWRFNVSADHEDCHELRRSTRRAYVDAESGDRVEWCPSFRPCEPTWACVGNNTCALGYEGDRCEACSKGFYRYNGECARCPDSPWLLVGMFALGAIAACFFGYILNSRQVNVAFLSIGIDYFQVLALFARARVRWPNILQDLFKFMSAFNLNLELAAPECALPDITYGQKWFFSMALPLAMLALFGTVYVSGYLWKLCILRLPASQRHEHSHKLISIGVISLYVMYVYLTRLTLDVFNCAPTDPPDGNQYMSGMTDVVCYESSLHKTLIPFAVAAFIGYVVALPTMAYLILSRNKTVVKHDQLCRALSGKDERYSERRYVTDAVWYFRQRWNRLYYLFKPGKWYWIILILMRKFLIAFSSLMFRNTPSYQLAFALLIMFSAYVIQVKNHPYMSPGDYEGELQKHIMLAEMGGGEGKVHRRIRDIMEAVERQNSNDKSRGDSKGAWRTAARDMYLKRASNRGLGASEEEVNVLAMFLVDYNAVESVLLACGVLVCLSGIMFLSARFNGELASYYQTEYDGLAITVATIIILSIAYFCIVLAFEIFYLLDKKRAAQLVGACSRRARKMAARSRRDKAKAIAMAGGARAGDASDQDEIGMERNALVMLGGNDDDEDAEASGASAIADMEQVPDASRWHLFRNDYKRLLQRVSELSKLARDRNSTGSGLAAFRGHRLDARKKSRQRHKFRPTRTITDDATALAVAKVAGPALANSDPSSPIQNPLHARAFSSSNRALNTSGMSQLRRMRESRSARRVEVAAAAAADGEEGRSAGAE